MRIVPVLDVMNGVVVRGIAGRRAEYRPIISRLTTSTRPLDVARAFREHFGLTELYLADLDAIAGRAPALPVYAALKTAGFRLMVDAGIRHADEGEKLATSEVDFVVAGLETLAGPATLATLCERIGSSAVIFSLDLKNGCLLGDAHAWGTTQPLQLAQWAVVCGVSQLIVLDLACVGVGGGPGTLELCANLVRRFPQVEVITGGGIRSSEDLATLQKCGVASVLLASALHDGRLSPAGLPDGILLRPSAIPGG